MIISLITKDRCDLKPLNMSSLLVIVASVGLVLASVAAVADNAIPEDTKQIEPDKSHDQEQTPSDLSKNKLADNNRSPMLVDGAMQQDSHQPATMDSPADSSKPKSKHGKTHDSTSSKSIISKTIATHPNANVPDASRIIKGFGGGYIG